MIPAIGVPPGAGLSSPGAGSGWGTACGSRMIVKTASRPVSSSAWRSKLMPLALTWTRAVAASAPGGISEDRSTFSAETPSGSSTYLPEPGRSTLASPATSMWRWLIGASACA